MRSKLVPAAAAVVALGAFGWAQTAGAGGRAETTVTIKAPGEVFGYVKSPKPNKCAKNRKVVVFQKKASGDVRKGSDEASKVGDRYMWSIGNPGLNGKKIYAKAPKTPDCQADKSPTIVAG